MEENSTGMDDEAKIALLREMLEEALCVANVVERSMFSYESIDYDDIDQVLDCIFKLVEEQPQDQGAAWYFFLNDWDRQFVLGIYDQCKMTGQRSLTERQKAKAKVVLRKMMTPRAK